MRDATNPLAINSGSAYNPPDYVIDDSSGNWGLSFPQGLSYIVPTGFGNCDRARRSARAPALRRLHAALRGPQRRLRHAQRRQHHAATVGSFSLADEYALGDVGSATSNSLQWFDNCGYGHSYEESADTDQPALGTRKELPSPPNNGKTYQYTIAQQAELPIVFGKECCASWYQENKNVTPNAWEPPVQIDNSYAAFIGAGGRR